MNIMLTDLPSLTLEVQESPAMVDSGASDFAGMFRQQLPDALTGVDQAIDLNQYFEIIPLQTEASTPGPEATRLPAAQIPSVQTMNFTDPVLATAPEQMDSQLAAPLTTVSSTLAEMSPETEAGEFLPAGGNQLPPRRWHSSVDPVMPETVVKTLPAADITPLASRPVDPSAVPGRMPVEDGLPALKPLPAALASIDTTKSERASPVLQSPGPVPPVLQQKTVAAEALQTVAGTIPADVKPVRANDLPRAPGLIRELTAAAAVSTPQTAVTAKSAQQVPLVPVIAGREFLPDPLAESAARVVVESAQSRAPLNPATSQSSADRVVLPRDNGLIADIPIARETIGSSEIRAPELAGQTIANNMQQTVTPVTSGTPVAAAPVAAGNAAPVNQQNPLPPQFETMSLRPGANTNEWSNGLGERVSWMINQKQNTATIRLDPPALGKLDVQIKIVDDAATITIQTQTAQTRDLIDSASIRLRDFLQDGGYQNVNVDVSQRQDQQQARSQTATASNSEQDDNSGQEQAADDQQQQTGYFIGDGLVDTFA